MHTPEIPAFAQPRVKSFISHILGVDPLLVSTSNLMFFLLLKTVIFYKNDAVYGKDYNSSVSNEYDLVIYTKKHCCFNMITSYKPILVNKQIPV
jgi:hypothetical protein